MINFTLPKPEALSIKLYNACEYILTINTTLELYDIRCQIKEYNSQPFDIYFPDGSHGSIDMNGRLDKISKAKLETFDNYIDRLIG